MTSNSFDDYCTYLERTLEYSRDALQKDARRLSERTARIADELGRSDPLINELGELQGSATMFEAACGRYAALRQTLKDARAFTAEPVA